MYPRGHWTNFQNHIAFANMLAKKYGFEKAEDWNKLSQKEFKDSGGNGLLAGTYSGSPWKFILNVVAAELYPDFMWLEWKVGCQAPNGFWKDREKVRFCLDVIANYESFSSLDDFYKISEELLKKHGITSIQNKFKTHMGMLRFAYPEKDWKEWKFQIVQKGFWTKRENIIAAIKYAECEEGIVEPSGWYKHTGATIDKHCGYGLLANHYYSSLSALLKDVYPEFPWKPYMFEKAPHKYWSNNSNCKEWLTDLMTNVGYKNPEDLYNIRYETIIKFPGGGGIIDRFGGSYIKLCLHIFPDLDYKLFNTPGKSKIANEWLLSIEKKTGKLQREFNIPGTRFRVDGFNFELKIVYEFLGDYWHGNPSIYKSEDLNERSGFTFGELYTQTMLRIEKIKELGYTVVYIWENDWKSSLLTI